MIDLDRCLVGDVRDVLPTLPAGSVQCIVTSPPFWGLRSYLPEGHADKAREIGAEERHDCLGWATGTPCGDCYVCHLVGVCRELRRVLRDDGTFWLELGDSYATGGGKCINPGGDARVGQDGFLPRGHTPPNRMPLPGLKPKDLCGIPWRVALALQTDGWWLRSDIVWARPNPMPSSVRDRPTTSHSYVFLLAKSAHYFYDNTAIAEPSVTGDDRRPYAPGQVDARGNGHDRGGGTTRPGDPATRNARSVWVIPTTGFAGAHFATFPEALVKRCILAGTSEAGCCAECGAPRVRTVETRRCLDGVPRDDLPPMRPVDIEAPRPHATGTSHMRFSTRRETTGWRPGCDCNAVSVPCLVLDPFLGSGTTAQVSQDLGRRWLGIELNPAYVDLQTKRAAQTGLPLLAGRDEP